MAYQYLSQKISPMKVRQFNPVTFWKSVYSDRNIQISFNHKVLPLFKVDIDKDYYFIFAGLKTVNNIMNVHVCVGHSILTSFKIEFDYRTMSDTRKLIAAGDYNFATLFLALYCYPLIKVKPNLKQMMSITSRFHYAVTFKFNSSYVDGNFRYLMVTVNFLEEDEGNSISSSVSSKYYTIYFMEESDIAFEKYVEATSELGMRLSKFKKFTQHHSISVLTSLNQDIIYFVYNVHNLRGIIQADLNKNEVLHTREIKENSDISIITNPTDINEAFFGVFNRYFADSLINYPSEYFIAFAEQYGLDIENVSAYDCLTLVDMTTV
jgi:hypothetical protein